MLVMKCRNLKYYFADQVPAKGGDAHAVKILNHNVTQVLGYNRVVVKTDQENAIKGLVSKWKAMKTVEIIPEKSPVGDSQSNAHAENAMKQCKGSARALKIALEDKLKADIPMDHPILAWMVKRGAQQLNHYRVGEDGKTAFRRLRGRDFNGKVVEFGEHVWYLKLKTKGQHSWKSRWSSGIWLGIVDESGENIIGTEG